MLKHVVALALFGSLLVACEEEKPAPTKAAASAARAPELAEAPSAAPSTPKPEAPKGVRMDGDTVLGLPTEKSKAPSEAEWAEAKDLESVPGNAGPTACEVRVVREWLRVGCKAFGGDDNKKFKPEKSEIVSGKTAEITAEVKSGVGSVVLPLREGLKLDGLISYSAGGPKKVLSVEWAKGTDGPILKTRTGM